MDALKVVAVIPAYNEAKTIGNVVRGILPFIHAAVVVDDHSSDATREEAHKAGAHVLSHPHNEGYDKTINDGFAEAATLGADVMFTFDADGEHSAQDVPRILEPILSGKADISVGQRPYTTHLAEWFFALYTRMRFGVRDPLCGFKAYRREVYEAVGFFDSLHSIGTELMLRGVRKKFRITTVPIELRQRENDSSRFYRRRFRANLKILKALVAVMRI